MGLGILEPRSGQHVPGTARLLDNENTDVDTSRLLKHASGRNSRLVLVPQPSDSPNDPLNWPLWQRDLILFILCLAGAVSATVGPAIAPINAVLKEEFHTTYEEVATWSGWQFWPAGIAGVICSAVGRVYGKRLVYIISTTLVFAGAIWNALATSPGSFQGSRILQGFGLGAFETIIPSTIGDLFFVHERGKRVAFFNLSFLGVSYFEPILGGYISLKHGWRTQFIIISCFLGPILILVFFLVPEHVYNRPQIYNTDMNSDLDSNDLESHPAQVEVDETKKEDTPQIEKAELPASSAGDERKKTWVQGLKLYNGRFSDENFFKMLLAPFVLFFYPATIWAFLFQGTFITWGIGVSIILAQLFAGPPNFFGPAQLGFIYTAPFIGALLSYILASLISDTLTTRLSRRNHSIYEPEFRILLVIPTAIFALPGLFAFGFASTPKDGQPVHWIIPSVLFGFLTFAVVMSCTATFSYVLDAHRDVSVEMMVSLLLLKNFFAFGSTYFINKWLTDWGAPKMFYVMGAIQTAVCVISVFMYVFGKRQRLWVREHSLLRWCGLYPAAARRRETGVE